MNIRRIRITASAMIISLLLPCLVSAEVNNEATYSIETNEITQWPQGADVYSDTAVLIEADTGIVLYNKGMNEQRYPASITKIMTVLLALENCSLDEQVTFTESGVANMAAGSNINMQAGEVLTMEQCLYAVMIRSANEVADQVAEYVGGTREAFIEMMNTRATELNCTNTHFTNPSGLPDEQHWSTAYDMALIFQQALNNEDFCKIIQTLQYTIPPTNLTPEARELTSHHALLVPSAPEYYEGCLGGKTGVTDASKNTLVTAAKRDDTRLIAVVMRSDAGQVCADTTALFNYGFDNFQKLDVAGGTLAVPQGTAEADLEVIQSQTDTDVLYNYYYHDYLVGNAIRSLAEVTAEATEAAVSEAPQTESADEPAVAEKTVSTGSMMKYRIIIVVLAILILLGLGLIISMTSKKSKR